MQIILAGHNESRAPLLDVAAEMRRGSGTVVSCYFDRDFPYARMSLSSADFVLLGLCRAHREVSSDEHAHAELLLKSVSNLSARIPCGLICDVDGYVSAPFLLEYGGLMRLVFTTGLQQAPPLFRDFAVGPADAIEVTRMVTELLRTTTARMQATM